jgi:hypothetical protein
MRTFFFLLIFVHTRSGTLTQYISMLQYTIRPTVLNEDYYCSTCSTRYYLDGFTTLLQYYYYYYYLARELPGTYLLLRTVHLIIESSVNKVFFSANKKVSATYGG